MQHGDKVVMIMGPCTDDWLGSGQRLNYHRMSRNVVNIGCL